jgi:hypothetical protein
MIRSPFKFMSIFAASACLLLGIGWIVDPAAILSLWGVQHSSAHFIVEHRFGALFLGVGGILVFARNAAPSPARSAISYGIVIGCLALLVVNVCDLAVGRIGNGILPGMGLQLVMILGFAYAQWHAKHRDSTQTR